MEETNTFQKLLSGEISEVTLMVDSSALLPLEKPPVLAVYKMNSEDFRVICEAISKKHVNKPWLETPELVAHAIDEQGLGNRWFRMMDEVAHWLAKSQPILLLDGCIA